MTLCARVGALDGSIIADLLDHAISTAQIDVSVVWEVRWTIEVETAALAARNATPEQCARIVELTERMSPDNVEKGQIPRQTLPSTLPSLMRAAMRCSARYSFRSFRL